MIKDTRKYRPLPTISSPIIHTFTGTNDSRFLRVMTERLRIKSTEPDVYWRFASTGIPDRCQKCGTHRFRPGESAFLWGHSGRALVICERCYKNRPVPPWRISF